MLCLWAPVSEMFELSTGKCSRPTIAVLYSSWLNVSHLLVIALRFMYFIAINNTALCSSSEVRSWFLNTVSTDSKNNYNYYQRGSIARRCPSVSVSVCHTLVLYHNVMISSTTESAKTLVFADISFIPIPKFERVTASEGIIWVECIDVWRRWSTFGIYFLLALKMLESKKTCGVD